MSIQSSEIIVTLNKLKVSEANLPKGRLKFSRYFFELIFIIRKLFLNGGQRIKAEYSRYVKAGDALLKNQDYIGANRCFDKALTINPYGYKAYYRRGVVKIRLHDYENSIADFDLAIKFSSAVYIPDRWFNLDNLTLKPGIFYVDELGNYRQLLRPEFTTAVNFQKGFANSTIENYEQAILDYNKVLELNDKHKEAYYNRAIAKHDTGDIEGARSDFRRAAELGISKANEMIEKYC